MTLDFGRRWQESRGVYASPPLDMHKQHREQYLQRGRHRR